MLRAYLSKPPIAPSPSHDDSESALVTYLLYVILPAWSAAGLFDWYCHKATDIEHTAGTTESLMHIAMFAEMGAPIAVASFCELNPGAIAVMLGSLAIHTATAYWDVAFASSRREIAPREQHAHSFLEVLPMAAFIAVSALSWKETKRLLLGGATSGEMRLRMKARRLHLHQLALLFAFAGCCGALPYANELYRCLRARSR